MDIPIGNIVSVSELQKDYRKVINKAKRTNKPVLVMRGNNPEVAVVDIKVMQDLTKRLEELEIEETLRIVKQGRKEYKEGKTVTAKSLAELL